MLHERRERDRFDVTRTAANRLGKALVYAAVFLLVDFVAFGLVYALFAATLRGLAPRPALSSGLLYMAFRVIDPVLPLQFVLLAAIRYFALQRYYPLIALAEVGAFFAVTQPKYSGPAVELLLGMFSFSPSHVPGPGIALLGSSFVAWVLVTTCLRRLA